MMSRRTQVAEPLRCSFCHKSQETVQKLISSPGMDRMDPRRAFICDECVMVCASILEDDRGPSGVGIPQALDESNPLLDHPLTPQLLAAVEHWIRHESLGADAAQEFAQVRAIAARWMRPGSRRTEPT